MGKSYKFDFYNYIQTSISLLKLFKVADYSANDGYFVAVGLLDLDGGVLFVVAEQGEFF